MFFSEVVGLAVLKLSNSTNSSNLLPVTTAVNLVRLFPPYIGPTPIKATTLYGTTSSRSCSDSGQLAAARRLDNGIVWSERSALRSPAWLELFWFELWDEPGCVCGAVCARTLIGTVPVDGLNRLLEKKPSSRAVATAFLMSCVDWIWLIDFRPIKISWTHWKSMV